MLKNLSGLNDLDQYSIYVLNDKYLTQVGVLLFLFVVELFFHLFWKISCWLI